MDTVKNYRISTYKNKYGERYFVEERVPFLLFFRRWKSVTTMINGTHDLGIAQNVYNRYTERCEDYTSQHIIQ
jgi:hypothetical protein